MANPIKYCGSKMALPASGWVGLLENVLLVSVASALTYITQNVSGNDFGQYTPLIIASASILLGYLQKVLANPVTPPAPTPVPTPVVPPTPDSSHVHDFPIN